MAYILDKETFTRKKIKITVNDEKNNPHESMIKHIEETSIIENYRDYFLYYNDTFIIVSDDYVLYSYIFEAGGFKYTSINSRIISIINDEANKILLIQTENYIKLFQGDRERFIFKFKFLIDFSETGKIINLLKFSYSISPMMIVETINGIFYIEQNWVKIKAQAVLIPEAIKLIKFSSFSDYDFTITYKTKDKIISSSYQRYVYDRNVGSKTFSIHLDEIESNYDDLMDINPEEKENNYNKPIYKTLEEKVIENCRKLNTYTNFISSEIIPINKDEDFIMILENNINKVIIFWENDFMDRLIVEIPKETKINILQNYRTILIYYFSDNDTNIILCERERNNYIDGQVVKLQIKTTKVERCWDITGVLHYNSSIIFSTTQPNIIRIANQTEYITKTCILPEEIFEIYYFKTKTTPTNNLVYLYKTKGENIYKLNNKEITLDFEMSEKNIKSLNEPTRYAIIEIGLIILSDDMEDFEF